MYEDLRQLLRLSRDRKDPKFKSFETPLWPVVSVNKEIGRLRRRLNPLNWKIKVRVDRG